MNKRGDALAPPPADQKLPLSVVIATRDRAPVLSRLLDLLSQETRRPEEIIVVDSSEDQATHALCQGSSPGSNVRWIKATTPGAAAQRHQGVENCSQGFLCFVDDDVILEPECLARLWMAIANDSTLGGVNAMITNQRYTPPGTISRIVFALMNGRNEPTFAGRVLGPAVNLLPEDRDDLPEVVPVEWLNTGCTIYRREALPEPVFDPHFTGYSLMEDLTLSLRVAQRGWKLANARTARIFHDSQPGEQKSNPAIRAEMELVNRHYVMTEVLNRRDFKNYLRLGVWELFQLTSTLASSEGRAQLPTSLRGKLRGLTKLWR